jgi:CheY-like chemotaxis protein
VVLNLAINARDAMKDGGTLTLATSNVTINSGMPADTLPTGDYVVLTVGDTGVGMSAEVLRNAFEPFFTTKATGEGSGLGLSQVYGIARQSGGDVKIESRQGCGTTVRVFLPRSPEPASGTAGPTAGTTGRITAPGDPEQLGRTTVLLVEDQPDVRETLSAIMAERGLLVVTAENAYHALRLIGEGLAFDVLLVDYAMPGMNGAELAGLVRKKRSTLPVVFITGYQDHTHITHERWILNKPFDTSSLMTVLLAALDDRRRDEANS